MTFQWQGKAAGFTLASQNSTSFASPVNYKVVDLNGDGMADIIYENRSTDSSSGFRALISDGNFLTEYPWGGRAAKYHPRSTNFQLADINGDGYPDLIYIDSAMQVHIQINNAGSGFPNDTYIPATELCVNPNTGFQLADVTGDGVPDLIWDIYYNKQYSFCVAPGDGKGSFSSATAFCVPQAAAYNTYQKTFQAIDMNGDGLADIVYEDANRQIHVLLSTGSGFQGDTVWGWQALPYDITSSPGMPAPYRLADVNGDGLPDFVYNGYQTGATYPSQFHVLMNNGNGFQPDAFWGSKYGYFYYDSTYAWAYFLMADLNGDGLADLLYATKVYYGQFTQPEQPPQGIEALLSTGGGFVIGTPSAGVRWLGIPTGPPVLADVNGDGVPDLVCLYENTGTFTLYVGNGPAPDLITGINNGIGGSYTINYTPSSGTGKFNQKLPFILQTVSSISASDGNGNVSTTSYAYSGGYYDIVGKEFRGFNYVMQTLPNSTVVVSSFYQDDVKKGLMYDQLTSYNGASWLEQVNTFQDQLPGNPPGGVHFPALTHTVTSIWDGLPTPRQITTSFTYDTYGNLLRDTSRGTGVSTEASATIRFTIMIKTPQPGWLQGRLM